MATEKLGYMYPEDLPLTVALRDLYPNEAFFGDPKEDELRGTFRKRDEGGYATTPDKAGTEQAGPADKGVDPVPAREHLNLDPDYKTAATSSDPALDAAKREAWEILVQNMAAPQAEVRAKVRAAYRMAGGKLPAGPLLEKAIKAAINEAYEAIPWGERPPAEENPWGMKSAAIRPLEQALAEWKQIDAQINALETELAKLGAQNSTLLDEIGPQMTGLKDKQAQVGNLLYKYSSSQATSTPYKQLWEAALAKVAAAEQAVLLELKAKLTHPQKEKRQISYKELAEQPKTSRLRTAADDYVPQLFAKLGELLEDHVRILEHLTKLGVRTVAGNKPTDTLGADTLDWLDDLTPAHLKTAEDYSAAPMPSAGTAGSSATGGAPGTSPSGYKAGDNVTDQGGRHGTVQAVQPDGKVQIQFSDGAGGPSAATYPADSAAIKRAAKKDASFWEVLRADVEVGRLGVEGHVYDWLAQALENGGVPGPVDRQKLSFRVAASDPDANTVYVDYGGKEYVVDATNPTYPRVKTAAEAPSGREMDPAAKPLGRAPDGMHTDPATGAPELASPNLTPAPKGPGKLAIVFPNLETKDYSRRPWFLHDWHKDLTTAAIRHGGQIEGAADADYLQATLPSREAAKRFIQKLVKQFNLRPEQIRLAGRHIGTVKTAKTYRPLTDAEALFLEKFGQGYAEEGNLPTHHAPDGDELDDDLSDADEPELAKGDHVEVSTTEPEGDDGATFTGTVRDVLGDGYVLVEKDGEPGSEEKVPAEKAAVIRWIQGIPLAEQLDAPEMQTGIHWAVFDAANHPVGHVQKTAGGPAGHVLVRPYGADPTPRWMRTADLYLRGVHRPNQALDTDWLDERALRGPHFPGAGLKY